MAVVRAARRGAVDAEAEQPFASLRPERDVCDLVDRRLSVRVCGVPPYPSVISLDFYFFHVEKCAGMSLRRAIYTVFRERYTDDQMHIPGSTRPGDQTIRDHADEEGYFEQVKVIADHSNPGELAALLGTEVEIRFSVTALRHPVDRALSHFHYFYGAGGSLLEVSPERLERFMTRHGNLQTTRLSNETESLPDAMAALGGMDAILLVEDYHRSIELLNRVNPFGVRFDPSVVDNVTETDDGADYKDLYSDDFRHSLERFCTNDLALHAEARRLFDEMCARAGV